MDSGILDESSGAPVPITIPEMYSAPARDEGDRAIVVRTENEDLVYNPDTYGHSLARFFLNRLSRGEARLHEHSITASVGSALATLEPSSQQGGWPVQPAPLLANCLMMSSRTPDNRDGRVFCGRWELVGDGGQALHLTAVGDPLTIGDLEDYSTLMRSDAYAPYFQVENGEPLLTAMLTQSKKCTNSAADILDALTTVETTQDKRACMQVDGHLIGLVSRSEAGEPREYRRVKIPCEVMVYLTLASSPEGLDDCTDLLAGLGCEA